MAIETLSLSQQQKSQLSTLFKREVKAIDSPKNDELNVDSEQALAAQSSNALQVAFTVSVPEPSEKVPPPEEVSYDKPVPPKIALLKLLVEDLSGEDIELSYHSYRYEGASITLSNGSVSAGTRSDNSESADTIVIDGERFAREQTVQVTQYRTIEQRFDYQMQGEFIKDGELISLSLDLSKFYQRTDVSVSTMTAEQLIDPLLIQIGDRPIGDIQQTESIDVNQDGTIDDLPMFSGDVGYLVYDKNGNGKADDGSELFGPKTNDGFSELNEYDDNQDGFIDHDDAIYSSLYIWQQQGNNRVWMSMEDADVSAVYLKPVNTNFNYYDENQEVKARISKTSFVISDDNQARAAHQIDLRL